VQLAVAPIQQIFGVWVNGFTARSRQRNISNRYIL